MYRFSQLLPLLTISYPNPNPGIWTRSLVEGHLIKITPKSYLVNLILRLKTVFFFGCFLLYLLVLGFQEGRRQGIKQQPGRIGRKEGGRVGRKESRKEGTGFLFTSVLETLAATVLFVKP